MPGGGFLLYVPLPIVYFALVATAGYVLLRFTQWGRNIYAIGGNREAARIAQIPIAACEWSVYAISASLAAFGGLVLASRLNTGSPIIGQDAPLQAFVAVLASLLPAARAARSDPMDSNCTTSSIPLASSATALRSTAPFSPIFRSPDANTAFGC